MNRSSGAPRDTRGLRPSRARRWRSEAAAAICKLAEADDPQTAIFLLADALLKVAGTTGPPVDLELLSSLRRVRQIDLLEMTEAGRLVPHEGGYLIQVNQSHGARKRRFTIAHEIGHTFFNEAALTNQDHADKATGLFDEASEEEYLCDLAAARTLLNPRWLEPMAGSCTPSLDSLLQIAEMCGASLEATAIELTRLGAWPCSFVFWEPGLRKAEQTATLQQRFPGWHDYTEPIEKLRAKRVYGPQGAPFLPLNKSVETGSEIWRCYAEQTATSGLEQLNLGRGHQWVSTQSVYAPFLDEHGSLRPRVISCLLWDSES